MIMLQTKFIDELVAEVGKLLPSGLGNAQQDAAKNLRAVLERNFNRMGLVTREEYDVQCAVLARTREKVEALEQRVANLESELLARH